MARPLRIEYNGAWYHVMNRGLSRNNIFFNDEHRSIFLDLLFEAHNRFQAEIHAYCLMDNHYHIFIRTPLGNLGRIMRHIDGVYTQRLNRLVKRDGPLFRGRYKAILVEADVYLLGLTRYIHLNPVKAKLVKRAEDYEWSSYRAYLSRNAPGWLSTKETLSYLDKNSQRSTYKTFVDEGVDDEIDSFYKKLKRIPILGTKNFCETVSDQYLKEEHKIADIPEHKSLVVNKSREIKFDEIISNVIQYFECERSALYKKSPGNRLRLIAIYISCRLGHYSHSYISRHLGVISISGVSKVYKRAEGQMLCNSEFKRDVEKIKAGILAMSNVKT